MLSTGEGGGKWDAVEGLCLSFPPPSCHNLLLCSVWDVREGERPWPGPHSPLSLSDEVLVSLLSCRAGEEESAGGRNQTSQSPTVGRDILSLGNNCNVRVPALWQAVVMGRACLVI